MSAAAIARTAASLSLLLVRVSTWSIGAESSSHSAVEHPRSRLRLSRCTVVSAPERAACANAPIASDLWEGLSTEKSIELARLSCVSDGSAAAARSTAVRKSMLPSRVDACGSADETLL